MLILGVGAFMLANKKSAGAGGGAAAAQVPQDANSLLATLLAPSLIDVAVVRQIYNAFIAAADNQSRITPSTSTSLKAYLRLEQYALTAFLKASVLAKGAQPNTSELMTIAYAPLVEVTGGNITAATFATDGSGADQRAAMAAALSDKLTDVAAVGAYIGQFANVYNRTSNTAQRKRLFAFILALKAKQIALVNTVQFQDAKQFDSNVYVAIANLPASSITPTTAANSILAV